jgi:hypothetical protein
MDKTLKEEAVHAVSEMDSLLNKLGGKILGLECMLEKALTTAEKRRARKYSEILATSPSTQTYSPNKLPSVVQPSDGLPPKVGLIVKAADPNTRPRD